MIFALVAVGPRAEQGHVDDVEKLRGKTVAAGRFEQAQLGLRIVTDRPYPRAEAVGRKLAAGDAEAAGLERICKTHDALGVRHESLLAARKEMPAG
jgi:hypothetical protein